MKVPRLQSLAIGLLAPVFTIGLTFASVELRYSVDRLSMETVAMPDFDSRSNPARSYWVELLIGHFHIHLIGYPLSSFPSTRCLPIPC